MQINRKIQEAASAPASQAPRTQVATPASTQTQRAAAPPTPATNKAAPEPGDIVTIFGKREELMGISFDNDHIRVRTVTDNTRGSNSPVKGTHTRFFYCESGERASAPTQGTAAQGGTEQPNVSARSDSPDQREAPRTPHRVDTRSVGPHRTPRTPRRVSSTVPVRPEPAQSSNMTPNTERRIHSQQMRAVKPKKQVVERRGWDSALLHDVAHIHKFDAGPSFLDQPSLLSSRPLGPSGTEYSL